MLRIFLSLPRAHKLLILPVATMVTVLGTQKLLAAFDITREDDSQQEMLTCYPDAPSALTLSVNTLLSDFSDQVIGASDSGILLANLRAQGEASGIDWHETISPSQPSASRQHHDEAQPQASVFQKIRQSIANGTIVTAPEPPAVSNNTLRLALRLFEQSEEGVIGGTSYEDISRDPLFLDDGEQDFEDELVAQSIFVPEWETYTVQRGDTFAVMAERTFGLGYGKVLGLLEQIPDEDAGVLTRWRVGDNFDFKLDESGELLALRIMKNIRSGYLIERDSEQDKFIVTGFEKTAEPTRRLYAGTVSGSFARSAEATGLSPAEAAELTALLSKKLDFRRDTRHGDKFQVFVEADMIEGHAMDSRILAAQYTGEKMALTVVRNLADNRFYTPEGHSLDPAFNRHPFAGKYRISSSFNLRRKHPITGRISPHRGTDFAMYTGTPVLSPADGRVIKSTHQSLAGNYIVIRHDNGYKTRYMHLSKRLASEGDRVTMGQKIALSGNTGRSTGPHLHYEIMVNNNQVDPMRVKLPDNKSLSGDALVAFKQNSKQLLAKLESDDSATVLASRSTPDSKPDGS